MFRLTRGLAIPVVILAACDTVGPEDRALDIAISVETSTPSVNVDESGTFRIECSVTMTATATGAADVVATWQGGERRWYAGVDRAVPLGVDELSAAAVAEFWQVAQLGAGETATTYWNFWAGFPFVIEHEFQFTTGTGERVKNASARTECGLDASLEDVPPPVVSDLVIDAPSPFQPGDTFTVSYNAAATGGLWQSRVIINGAYHVVKDHNEQLVRESHRRAGFRVPPGIVLGMPIDVSVAAVDALGQWSQTVSARSAPLVDETPPSFLRATTSLTLESGVEAWLVGQYAAGDTIPLLVVTADNQELGELILEIGSERRDIALAGHYLSEEVPVELPAGWIGAIGLSVHVTDAQGLAGPRHQSHPDSIRLFPVTPRLTASWSAEGRFVDAAWDETRERLYLTITEAAEVVVVSTVTMSTERRIPLPGVPVGVDFTAGGDSLIITLPESGSLAIVDLASDQVTLLPLDPVQLANPRSVAVMSGDRALVEVSSTTGSLEIAHVDLPAGTVAARTAVGAWGPVSMRLVRSADRSVAGVHSNDGCLMIYSTAADGFGGCIGTNALWYSISVAPAGTRFLSARTVIDVASATVHRPTWGLSPWVSDVGALSPDGESFFLSDTKGLLRIRTSDGVVLERIPYARLYGRIIPAADGSRLLTLSNDPDAWPYQFTVGVITLQ
jgi:hypothetical protein